MEEVRMSLRMPKAVAVALRALAEEHERSLNREVVAALRGYAVAAGKTIPPEVQADGSYPEQAHQEIWPPYDG